MNEQSKKYKNSLNTMQGPILFSQCLDIKLDLHELMKSAKCLVSNTSPHK